MRRIGHNEINDDDFRILDSGTLDDQKKDNGKGLKWVLALLAAGILVLALAVGAYVYLNMMGYFESQKFEPTKPIEPVTLVKDASKPAYVSVRDTVVGDSKVRVYYPRNAMPALHLGPLDHADESVVFAAEAAFRASNDKILGSFVLEGEELAKGNSVKGFCAMVGDQISIGWAKSTDLFGEAKQNNGYFFRQYCLVAEGLIINNRQEHRYLRKALCIRDNEVFIVETLSTKSLSDFSQILIDMGVEYALNLVGTRTYGWYVDKSGTRHNFTGRPADSKIPENTSYLIWR